MMILYLSFVPANQPLPGRSLRSTPHLAIVFDGRAEWKKCRGYCGARIPYETRSVADVSTHGHLTHNPVSVMQMQTSCGVKWPPNHAPTIACGQSKRG